MKKLLSIITCLLSLFIITSCSKPINPSLINNFSEENYELEEVNSNVLNRIFINDQYSHSKYTYQNFFDDNVDCFNIYKGDEVIHSISKKDLIVINDGTINNYYYFGIQYDKNKISIYRFNLDNDKLDIIHESNNNCVDLQFYSNSFIYIINETDKSIIKEYSYNNELLKEINVNKEDYYIYNIKKVNDGYLITDNITYMGRSHTEFILIKDNNDYESILALDKTYNILDYSYINNELKFIAYIDNIEDFIVKSLTVYSYDKEIKKLFSIDFENDYYYELNNINIINNNLVLPILVTKQGAHNKDIRYIVLIYHFDNNEVKYIYKDSKEFNNLLINGDDIYLGYTKKKDAYFSKIKLI